MTNKEFLESITLEGEEWRDVVGYEGLYMVSSYGRCLSMGRITIRKNGIQQYTEPKLISYNMVAGNYLHYRLWKDNREKHMSIHRLVAIAFIPNPNGYLEVDHIDTNKTNNIVSNLRWCTRSMNQQNPITRKRNSLSKLGRTDIAKSQKKAVVRINPKDKIDVKFYESASATHREDGFNHSKVCEVCRGERKLHGGYIWMWASDYKASNQ